MKQRLKALAGHALFGARLHQLRLSRCGVVVVFHRVNDRTPRDGLTCSVRSFERYCEFFARHFDVVPLGDLVNKLERGAPLDGELSITFDDGYQDNHEYAAPILKSHGLPATFFVTTGFMGSTVTPWWDRQQQVSHSWMTWEHVRQLHRAGFEIGSHTRSHVDLGCVDGGEAWREIVESRLELERHLGAAVTLFAYPYGRHDNMTEDNRALVRRAGFRCCCSCYGGLTSARTDPLKLRRVAVSSWYDSPYHFGGDLLLHRGE